MTVSRSTRLPWLIGLGVVVIAAVLVWLVFFSPVLAAQHVLVDGAEQVSPEEVIDVAAVPTGSAMAQLPLDDIADRVEQLDAVASASVERQWPNTVRIVVTERRAVAITKTAEGFGLVGSDGDIYRVEDNRPADLPLLARLSQTAGEVTSESSGDASVAAFDVARALPRALRVKVDEIQARSVSSVQLQLRNGSVVDWGTATGSVRKSAVLLALLRHKAERYDVSVPDAPAWSQ